MQQNFNTPTYVEETTKVAEIKDFQGRTRFKVALAEQQQLSFSQKVNKSMQQNFNTPTYVEETTKVAEIKDFQGRTRFKVALTDFDTVEEYQDNDDLREFDYRFQVTVVSYCYGEDPVTLVSREFDDIEKAKKFFTQMRDQYVSVVTAETKDYEDIRIYARKTGYHIIMPECCATCDWACPMNSSNTLFDDWKKNRRGKFLCTNSALYNPNSTNREGMALANIRPQVEAMGLCSGYVRRLNQAWKDPNHTDRAYRDHDTSPEMIIETIVKSEIDDSLERAIDPIIMPEIGKKIEEQLSKDPPIIEGNRGISEIYVSGGAD